METFKTIATRQLSLLWYIFMLGILFLHAIPVNACGSELLYQRFVLANYVLLPATVAAAMLLFAVKMCVFSAEASIIAVARAAKDKEKAFDAKHEATLKGGISNKSKWHRLSLCGMLLLAFRMYVIVIEACIRAAAAEEAANSGRKAFDADREAAAVKGLGSIATKWKRVLLRGMLLLAVALSAAASFLAIFIFEDWCQSRSCNAGYGLGSPFSVFMMVAITLVHGYFAWVAVCKN